MKPLPPDATIAAPPSRAAYSKTWRKEKNRERAEAFNNDLSNWCGIDGEGTGSDPHMYTLLSAATAERENLGSVENWEQGLSTEQCFEFLLDLPVGKKYFAYSFLYDLTKIFADMPNELIYKLARPDLRKSEWDSRTKPIHWKGYRINLERTKFTLIDADPFDLDRMAGRKITTKQCFKLNRKIVVWDIWRFFGMKFTSALQEWKVKTDQKKMQAMKDARGTFTVEDRKAVTEYNLEECACMGQLAQRLTQAHIDADIDLRGMYFGAGSSAGALLRSWDIKHLRGEPPEAMQAPIAQAFFGGRFENSVIGRIPQKVWGYDIASAYPYQLYRLPCLVHAQWRRTKNRADISRPGVTALVRYRLRGDTDGSWGPFPFRSTDGTIVYPGRSGGGWLWHEEYLQGERLFDGVEFREAWISEKVCTCHPFARIPELYRERIRIGKEGKGLTLKLAMNSCYGKLAQSVGENPPYQSWIWAGLITSTTRAQLLEMLGGHQNRANCFMFATDGVFGLERLACPEPIDTGTSGLFKPNGEAAPALGSWEEKSLDKGVFCARPGIYFPLAPTADQLKEVRARGVGKGVMYQHWKQVVEDYEAGKETSTLPEVTRFIGLITGIHTKGKGDELSYIRSSDYGRFIQRPAVISFDPLPKRDRVLPDGRSLALRSFSLRTESKPYDAAIQSPEAEALRALADMNSEQADVGDLGAFDGGL